MQVSLTHEKGKAIRLTWDSFVEKFSELRSRDGDTTEVSRDQEATALRISTSLPVEKFIRFQDHGFQEQAHVLVAAAFAEINRMRVAESDGEKFVHTKEFVDFVRFFRHHFYWEAGRYEFDLEIQLLERRAPVKAKSQFTVSESDVELLQQNVEFLGQRLKQIAAGVPQDQQVSASNFVNPRLTSKRIMVRR